MKRHPSRRALLSVGSAAALAGVATAAVAAPSDSEPVEATGVRHQDLILVPMRDGVHVALSLWLPLGPGPFPAILMRSLDRRRYVHRLEMVDDLLAAGYAFVSSDVRGRFESEGVYDPTYGPKEGLDGYDTVQWMAAQPWCDGRIGTYGLSHQSFYQVQTALRHPPALKAIATWTGGYKHGARLVEGAPQPMSGGVTAMATTMVWLPNEAGAALDKLAAQGQDVTEARQTLRRMRTHPQETFNHLPLREAPITRYAGLKELFSYRLSTTSKPDGGDGTPLEGIEVPAFHECGWFDPEGWSQIQAFTELQTRAGTALARENQHMTMGPWPHAMVYQDRLGDAYWGDQADNAGSGINKAQVRFFDKYVKGQDQTLPKVRYFVMGANEWREGDAWPPAHMTRRKLYLHSGGRANTAAGDGRLDAAVPASGRSDRFVYDPLNPAPTLGGAFNGTLTVFGMLPGPLEQSPLERRPDVLVYTSAPLEADMEISGPMATHLFVATSAVDTDFTAKVTQVLEDGRSYNLGDGILRLSGRDLTGERQTVTPGETYKIAIACGQTSVVLLKGQRIRLQISSSNFPQFDRNMNTGNPVGVDATGPKATQTVWHDGVRASYLELPMGEAV